MPLDRAEAIKQMNEAGKAYVSFRKRDDRNFFFTLNQRRQRLRNFLNIHVDIYDSYRGYFGRNREYLNREAQILFTDIHDHYNYIKKFNTSARFKKDNNPEAKINLQGKAFENYSNRLENKEVNDETLFENDQAANGVQEQRDDEPSAEQMKGVREIFAWMYRTTTKHQKFVDGISQRSPREKLIICWIVEREKRHNLNEGDLAGLALYQPSLDNFRKKVMFSKHWYKLGAKDANWGLVSDAAAMAYRLEGGAELKAYNEAQNQAQNQAQAVQGNVRGMLEKDEEPDNLINTNSNKEENKIDNKIDAEIDAEIDNNIENEVDNGSKDSAILDRISKRGEEVGSLADDIIEELQKGKEGDAKRISDDLSRMQRGFALLEEELGPEIEKDLYTELNSGPPGAETNIRALNAELQYRTKYVGILRQLVSNAQGLLKGRYADQVKTDKAAFEALEAQYKAQNMVMDEKTKSSYKSKMGKFDGYDLLNNISQWTGIVLDSPMTLLNIVNFFAQVSGYAKGFKTSRWTDLLPKGADLLNSALGVGKSGLGATTTAATMYNNAGWVATTAVKTTSAALGIAAGTITTGVGLWNLGKAHSRLNKLEDVQNQLGTEQAREENEFPQPAEDESQQVREDRKKRKGRNQIVQNVIKANRNALKQTEKTAALSSIQGTLTAASGALTFFAGATLGVTGIISAAMSLGAMIIGLTNTIMKKRSKQREIKEVIDCYVGMDGLYNDYVRKNSAVQIRDLWIKDQGGKEKICDRIREDVVGVLGFSSEKKMYTEIMYQYAKAIYELTFYENGRRLKATDVKNADGTVLKKAQYNYGRILETLGFVLDYGDSNKEPTPGVNQIFKALTA